MTSILIRGRETSGLPATATVKAPPVTTAIEFRDVSKTFVTRRTSFSALTNVSLSIPRGDIFGIVGYSGAGKSTLLRTVNALERPTSGSVFVNGHEISALRGRALYQARQRIGMIFQQFNLLQSRTVFANIAYPLALAGVAKPEVVDRVEELLEFVGLSDKAFAYPSRLSGGQKQRVGIARALANRPDVLISDEATSALDPDTTAEVLELLKRTNAEYGITIALVTHEIDVVRSIADRVAVMERGEVVEHGTAYRVFSRPEHPTTRRFVSSVLQHVPSDETLDRIRRTHSGRLVQIAIDNPDASDPYLSRISREHGVDATVVFGGVSEIAAKLFGSLIVELSGDDRAVDAAIRDLARTVSVTEVPHG
ncbi:D-methionine transport system ATP-binding protein [Microcella alkaliphila]|uniref:D-methionine transport system ATP-binding protein n=1 Tax=Microcella alkaliphila TaxID=279828 RepID=A0A4V2FNB6_9MICO|nr:D-methionine transport system ATP-binding protein [Microcella alkaliphila]